MALEVSKPSYSWRRPTLFSGHAQFLPLLALACATTRPPAQEVCNERCEFLRAGLLPILAVEHARSLDRTVFCVSAEVGLSPAELAMVLDHARSLGIEAWTGLDCEHRAGRRLDLHVSQVKRTTSADECWFPFEFTAPVDYSGSGSVLVRKERGRWMLLRIEYDDSAWVNRR